MRFAATFSRARCFSPFFWLSLCALLVAYSVTSTNNTRSTENKRRTPFGFLDCIRD